jgi:hypothetical protein
VHSLATQNRFYKRAAAGCLRAVAKHSAPLAQAVVDCRAVDALVACLEEFDPGVKEAAAWCLGYIASHSPELAQQVSLTWGPHGQERARGVVRIPWATMQGVLCDDILRAVEDLLPRNKRIRHKSVHSGAPVSLGQADCRLKVEGDSKGRHWCCTCSSFSKPMTCLADYGPPNGLANVSGREMCEFSD